MDFVSSMVTSANGMNSPCARLSYPRGAFRCVHGHRNVCVVAELKLSSRGEFSQEPCAAVPETEDSRRRPVGAGARPPARCARRAEARAAETCQEMPVSSQRADLVEINVFSQAEYFIEEKPIDSTRCHKRCADDLASASCPLSARSPP